MGVKTNLPDDIARIWFAAWDLGGREGPCPIPPEEVPVSWVYFIGGGPGMVKIGYSTNLPKRMHRLQSGNHRRLKLLAKVEGGKELEREYHSRFGAWRKSGEWFARVPEIEAEITRLQGVSL